MSQDFFNKHQHLMPDQDAVDLMGGMMGIEKEDAQNMETQFPWNDGNPGLPNQPGPDPYDTDYPMQNSDNQTNIQSGM
jgi:hypothetical protein